MLRVDRNAGDFTTRVRNLCQRQRQVGDLLDAGQLILRQTTHMGARWLMADDQSVGLATVDQREGHTGVADVAQAALPFDDVPMVIVIVWREIFDGARHKVSDNSIQRHAGTSDQNTCLPSGAECALHTFFAHGRIQRERGVHFTDGAVSAHRQHPLARSLFAIRDGVLHVRNPYIVQRLAVNL